MSLLFISGTAGTSASSTSQDTLKSVTLPLNTFTRGTLLRVTAMGVYGTTGTPTLRMRMNWGATTLLDSGVLTMPTTITNLGWSLSALFICMTTGSTGTVEAQGVWPHETGAAETPLYTTLQNTATVTIDTTVENILALTATWGTNNAANTISCRQFIVERL